MNDVTAPSKPGHEEQVIWSAFRQLDVALCDLSQLHEPEALCIALGSALYTVQVRNDLSSGRAFELATHGWLLKLQHVVQK